MLVNTTPVSVLIYFIKSIGITTSIMLSPLFYGVKINIIFTIYCKKFWELAENRTSIGGISKFA